MSTVDKKILSRIIDDGVIHAERKEKLAGTNCQGFRVTLSNDKGEEVVYFMKQSFLKGLGTIQEDYELLKNELKNIIPNTVFLQKSDGNIFSLSEPVVIQFDVCETKNKDYLIEVLSQNKKLLKQLKFFIRKFRKLEQEGKIIDLYGKENLVYTDNGKLKYIDSYLVFHDSKTVIEESLLKVSYLEDIVNNILLY